MTEMETAATPTEETTPETAPAPLQKLAPEQEIAGLRAVHQFLSNFDKVPGNLAGAWGQALDTVAVVANSLIAKAEEAKTVEK